MPARQQTKLDNKAIDVLLSEYETLSSEIRDRLQLSYTLVNIALIYLGGLITVVTFVLKPSETSSAQPYTNEILLSFALLSSLVFSSLFHAYILNQIEIGTLGLYLQTINRKYICSIVQINQKEDFFSYSRYHVARRNIKNFLTAIVSNAPSHLMLFILSLTTLGITIWMYWQRYNLQFPNTFFGQLALILVCVNSIYFIFVIPMLINLYMTFKKIN